MGISRKNFLAAAGASLLLSACTSTTSLFRKPAEAPAEPQRVYYAGVSITGNFKDNKVNAPFASQMLEKLDGEMGNQLKSVECRYLDLKVGEPGNIQDADALACTLAVDLETLVVYPWPGNRFKAVADIYAQLLFYDFAEKKVIRTVPVNFQYITLLDHKPNRREQTKLMEGLYTGKLEGLTKGLIQTAVEKLQTLIVRSSYGAYLKVRSVSTTDRALNRIRTFAKDPEQFRTQTALLLTRSLVDHQDVAAVPYTPGQAIGGKMIGRFSNGISYSLALPDPDYVFDLSIEGFKTLRDTTASQSTDLESYFALCRFKVTQKDLGTVYMDRTLRAVGETTLLKGQKGREDVAYTETLMGFFEKFAESLSSVNSDWLELAVPEDQISAAEKDLEAVAKVVALCR